MPDAPDQSHPSDGALLAAAQRCFVRDGYEVATMRGIAEEAGTSTSRLYVAFENKQALLHAVLSTGNARLAERYLLPALHEPRPPWDRVMALVEGYLQFYIDERELATLMALSLVDPDDPRPAMQDIIETQQAQLQAALDLVRELTADTTAGIDAAHVLRWGWAAISGLVSTNMRLPHLAVNDDELDRIVGLGMRFTRAGLREAGALPPPPGNDASDQRPADSP